MNNYTNLTNLYSAYQNKKAYEQLENDNKNKKKSLESDWEKGDLNKNGKLDDKKSINNNIKEKESVELLFDVNGDSKIDMNDLLNFNTNVDLDGDEVISDAEKTFLAEQKTNLENKLLKELKADNSLTLNDYTNFQNSLVEFQKNNTIADDLKTFLKTYESTMMNKIKNQTDLTGDKKTDINDLNSFLSLTEKKDEFVDLGNNSATFLNNIESKIEKKALDFDNSGNLTLNDLAKAQYTLDQATIYKNGQNGNLGSLTEEQKVSNFDYNKDGKFDEKDIQSLNTVVNKLAEKLGVKDANGDTKIDGNDIAKIISDYQTAKVTTLEKKVDLAGAKDMSIEQLKAELEDYETSSANYKALNKYIQARVDAKTAQENYDEANDETCVNAQADYDAKVLITGEKKTTLTPLETAYKDIAAAADKKIVTSAAVKELKAANKAVRTATAEKAEADKAVTTAFKKSGLKNAENKTIEELTAERNQYSVGSANYKKIDACITALNTQSEKKTNLENAQKAVAECKLKKIYDDFVIPIPIYQI